MKYVNNKSPANEINNRIAEEKTFQLFQKILFDTILKLRLREECP